MPGPEAHSEFTKVRIAEEDQQLSRDALRSMRWGVLLASHKDPGCAFSSGRTKGILQILSLRTGATRSVIMRHETGRPPIQIGWFLRMYYASSSRLGCLMNQTAAFFFRRIKWN